MDDENVPMREKVREILFRYRATPLNNGKSPAERYLHRPMRIQLDALKPTKFQKSSTPAKAARQLSVGERVQARYYGNNKNLWKPGTVIEKFGQLHYKVRFDDGYTLKRHIDQLRTSRVQPHQTTVRDPQVPANHDPDFDEDPQTSIEELNLGDLVTVPETRQDQLPIPVDVDEPVNVGVEIPEDIQAQQLPRRSTRQRQQPVHLRRDYVL